MKFKLNTDLVGIGASIACAIHCAILPLFLSSLPLFGINIIHNSFFEFGMIGFAFLLGLLTLRHGFVRHHRSYVPFMLFSAGMLFLLAKQVWHNYELLLLPFAVILIVTAHISNLRLKTTRRRRTGCKTDCQ
ncbi:MAG TPA: MerC domain-containing protein [Puia sp.]|nr:MerC domain-containing protein [Puia sp.]